MSVFQRQDVFKMTCIALLDSGNYAFFLAGVLKEKGVHLEVVPAPCSIAVNGCGFCIRFAFQDLDKVKAEASKYKMPLRKIYMVEEHGNRERYKILPEGKTNSRIVENN
jgi:hypothetical protein